ncbi:MAG TPA: YbhB/YbcL family Raf kinase inhibitor-like protein [Burkholderiaceae bacterium]|nr:YbhB/YbcL family Raf kinase inhibitor-like protein [Burkholderiaceae bacterium]
MKLWSNSFADGARIPGEFAFCVIDPVDHVKLSGNRNPHLAWSGAPARTASFVVVCRDGDVPSRPDDVNQEGREIPSTLPRVDFYHWLLVDIPPTLASIAAGGFSDGVTPRGKSGPAAAHGTRQGVNDYTGWFASDRDMNGDYFGYDGPCPPWNDSMVHHYEFSVHALDIARVPLEGRFAGADLLRAIQGHVLDSARLVGTYTLNPRIAGS